MSKKKADSENSQERLKALCRESKLPPYLLITCPDEIRRRRTVTRLLSAVKRTPDKRKLAAVQNIDGRGLDERGIAALEEQLATLPLFGSAQILLLHHAEEVSASATKNLVALVAKGYQDNVLIITAAGLAATNPLQKALAAKDLAINLGALDPAGLKAWTKNELSTAGIESYPPALLDVIIEYCLESPDAIAPVIAHFALYLESNEAGLSAFEKLFPAALSANEYKFLDYIMEPSPVKCEVLLSQLLSEDKNPLAILGLLARNFSQLMELRAGLESKCSTAELQNSLNIKPWLLNKLMNQARRRTLPKLAGNFHAILRADSKLKNRCLGPELVYSELIASVV